MFEPESPPVSGTPSAAAVETSPATPLPKGSEEGMAAALGGIAAREDSAGSESGRFACVRQCSRRLDGNTPDGVVRLVRAGLRAWRAGCRPAIVAPGAGCASTRDPPPPLVAPLVAPLGPPLPPDGPRPAMGSRRRSRAVVVSAHRSADDFAATRSRLSVCVSIIRVRRMSLRVCVDANLPPYFFCSPRAWSSAIFIRDWMRACLSRASSARCSPREASFCI